MSSRNFGPGQSDLPDKRSERLSVAFGPSLRRDEEDCLKRFPSASALLLVVATPAYAEDGLALSASTRLRYETIEASRAPALRSPTIS